MLDKVAHLFMLDKVAGVFPAIIKSPGSLALSFTMLSYIEKIWFL